MNNSTRNYSIGIFLKFAKGLFFLCVLINTSLLQAQPSNDDCSNASEINFGPANYDTGIFISEHVSLKNAAIRIGESFSSSLKYAGLNQKSVWYYFELPTSRSINITLKQKDSAIGQSDVGLEVYSSTHCFPNLGEISQTLVPITKFGEISSSCVKAGKYYIHVASKEAAMDTIWLEIKVNSSFPALFDHPETAYDFGVINGSKDKYIEVGCLSLDDSTELCPELGMDYKDYQQSAWMVFTASSKPEMLEISARYYDKDPDTFLTGYRIYEGDALQSFSSLKIIKGCGISKTYCSNNGSCYNLDDEEYIFKYLCQAKPDARYSIQLLFSKKQAGGVQVSVSCSGGTDTKSANPKNLPAAYQLGVLGSALVTDYFACNGELSNNLCGTVNPSYILEPANNGARTVMDTFDIVNWVTFSLPEDGILYISHSSYDINGSGIDNAFGTLFSGDVTKDCNLKQLGPSIWTYFNECLPAGNYSYRLQGSTKKTSWNYNDGFQCDLGNRNTIHISFRKPEQPDGLFYKPELAENLGDITGKLAKGIKVTPSYVGIPETDTAYLNSRKGDSAFFVYREFYLNKPSFIKLNTLKPKAGTRSTYTSLYSGKVSASLDSIRPIDSMYFYPDPAFYFHDSAFFRSGCIPLPAGWYSLVDYVNPWCDDAAVYYSHVKISGFIYPAARYNRPYKACNVNGGNPLVTNPNRGSPAYHVYTRIYKLPVDSFGCMADTPFSSHPITFCDDTLGWPWMNYSKVSYYVFSLNEESYIKIHPGYLRDLNYYNYHFGRDEFHLYDIDVRKDSLKMLDSSHILGNCGSKGEFCRVPPGIYTLAVFGYGTYAVTYSIEVDKVLPSPEDFASKAVDMGTFTSGVQKLVSKPGQFTCTDGAFITDPVFYHTSVKHKDSSSIPYPIPLKAVPSFYNRNIWFTFNIPDPGTGKITLNMVSATPKMTKIQYPYSVYESDENGSLPFSEVQKNGLVDSTLLQKLKFIANNNNNLSNQLSFYKPDCTPRRYYILVENPWYSVHHDTFYSNSQVYFTADYIRYKNTDTGDFCKNAQLFTLDDYGQAYSKLIINCHSVGESFGEDNTFMDCLGDTALYNTSWLCFQYTGKDRADISFKLNQNTMTSPEKIHYRVLYGNCDAMTPGPCVSNPYSAFRLDCMAAGYYYIQIAYPKNTVGAVGIEVKADPTTYPACKPFSLTQPVANFEAIGGCNGDDVAFRNYSTAGPDITYLWSFGNGDSSTEKDPVVHFTAKNSIDTYMVTLIVCNAKTLEKDELRKPVFVFRDTIILQMPEDTEVLCGNKTELNPYCNYANAAIFEWTPTEGLNNPYSQNPVLYPLKDMTYHLKVQVANCYFEDSIRIKTIDKVDISGADTICPGEMIQLTASDGYILYKWNTGETGRTIKVSQPGDYTVNASNGNCAAWANFKVNERNIGISGILSDTTVCSPVPIVLKSDRKDVKFQWSTGETTSTITAEQPGTYWLKIIKDDCSHTDTTHIILNALKKSLPDSLGICEGESVKLSGAGGDKYLWSTGENSSSILIDTPGKYWLRTVKENCFRIDTVHVRTNKINILPDTAELCNGYKVNLDAGIADSYQWSTGSKERKISVNLPGRYWVNINRGSCKGTDSIWVKGASPSITHFNHDTTFCRHFSVELDAGEGKSYYWLPGGEQTRKITATRYGTYFVQVTNKYGCVSTDSIRFTERCGTLFVPDAFIPDENGSTKFFKAIGADIAKFEMTIYNRWGEQLFHTNNFEDGWDGRFKGVLVPQDVYIYIIKYSAYHTSPQMLGGTVTILR